MKDAKIADLERVKEGRRRRRGRRKKKILVSFSKKKKLDKIFLNQHNNKLSFVSAANPMQARKAW